MRLGYVCTNYNNSSFTRAAVASLLESGAGHDVRIVIVDNQSATSDAENLKDIARAHPAAEVVFNKTNAGYFPGLNVGIDLLRRKYPDIRHFVIGNNDLTFPREFVGSVERNQHVLDEWAVVAPDLVTPDGVHQNPHVIHAISPLRRLVWDVYFSAYPAALFVKSVAHLTRRFTVRPENAPGVQLYKTAGPIEQGYGACYLIGPKFFNHFARLCAPTFMMQEEFFLYEQLLTIGQLTYYDPSFVVMHHGHATTSQMPSRRRWEIGRDAHRVYRRYHALSAAAKQEFLADHAKEVGT